ncbi:MAG: sugar ABC transporter substrate-binding protein [Spirochaetes bacterium]|nr:sugar ABC transporter substrate-binding protein [Spirochaetota bacterium]
MKKANRIVLALLVCGLFVCSLAFAAGGAEGATSKGKKKLIAYSGFAPTLPFFIELGKGVEDKCKELGFDFTNVSPAETKPELQVQGLENAIIKGVDGIVMSPIDARALKNPFDMALAKKIPIIVVDAPVNHPAALAFFGTDNLAAAQGAGRYIVEKTKGKGDLLLLGGQIGHPNGDKRLKGVKDTCEAAGMKVIVRPTDWDTDKAMQFATDELMANKNISAIFSCWDPGALAAKQAAKTLGLLDRLIIVGFDGDQANYRAIKAGEITATARQQPYLMGQKGTEMMAQIFAGKSDFPKETLVPGEMVDITNVDKYLK